VEKIFAACILWIGTDCLPDFNYFSILNVSINGNSFYFYMILPLADFSYVRSMLSLKISRRQMYAVFLCWHQVWFLRFLQEILHTF